MAATIGEQLRLAREERAFLSERFRTNTHLIRYLEAIESADFKNSPWDFQTAVSLKPMHVASAMIKKAVEAYSRSMRIQERQRRSRYYSLSIEGLHGCSRHAFTGFDGGAGDYYFGPINSWCARRVTLVPTSLSSTQSAPGRGAGAASTGSVVRVS